MRLRHIAEDEYSNLEDEDQFDEYVEPHYLTNAEAAEWFTTAATLDPQQTVEIGYYHVDSDMMQYSVLEVGDDGNLMIGI